jgi:hypothetical protein
MLFCAREETRSGGQEFLAATLYYGRIQCCKVINNAFGRPVLHPPQHLPPAIHENIFHHHHPVLVSGYAVPLDKLGDGGKIILKWTKFVLATWG